MAKKKASGGAPPTGAVPPAAATPPAGDGRETKSNETAQLISLVFLALLFGVLFIQGCWTSQQVREVAVLRNRTNTNGLAAEIQLKYELQELELQERILVTGHLLVAGTAISVIGCALSVFAMLQLEGLSRDKIWLSILVPGTLGIALGVLMTIYAAPKTTGSQINFSDALETTINPKYASPDDANEKDPSNGSNP